MFVSSDSEDSDWDMDGNIKDRYCSSDSSMSVEDIESTDSDTDQDSCWSNNGKGSSQKYKSSDSSQVMDSDLEFCSDVCDPEDGNTSDASGCISDCSNKSESKK